MIRTTLSLLVTAALLVACSDSARAPADNSTRAALDGVTPSRDVVDTPTQSTEENELTDIFAGIIPWDEGREGIITTESGLQIHVLNTGDKSGELPSTNDSVSVHYEGRLAADGTTFDSSYQRGAPATFGVTQVIPGWTEALLLMRPGDEWIVYLPADIAYGERGTPGGPIGPNADLIFRMNLIEIIKDDTPGAEFFDANLPWNANGENVKALENGLQYIVLKSGDTRGTKPTIEDEAVQNFEIRKTDGTRIDSSFANGRPETIGVANLIPGWSIALQQMHPGDDWLIYLPADMAFGERGTPGGPIGPNEDIIMRLNLVETVVPIPPQVSNTAAWEQNTPWNSDADGIQKTESGIEYIIIESGDASGVSPTRADTVDVYYEGRLTTGETFDSAYERGESIQFGVTQVIAGWTETLQLMKPGDRWLVYIPSNIAYGENPRPGGLIKPGDDLIFEMQLLGVR